jgi:hypothetical protein
LGIQDEHKSLRRIATLGDFVASCEIHLSDYQDFSATPRLRVKSFLP